MATRRRVSGCIQNLLIFKNSVIFICKPGRTYIAVRVGPNPPLREKTLIDLFLCMLLVPDRFCYDRVPGVLSRGIWA